MVLQIIIVEFIIQDILLPHLLLGTYLKEEHLCVYLIEQLVLQQFLIEVLLQMF